MLSAACWSAVGTSSPAKSGPVQTHRDTSISVVLICCICSGFAELKGQCFNTAHAPTQGLLGFYVAQIIIASYQMTSRT